MRDEGDRLHQGLRDAFAELLGQIDGARLEERSGYRLVVCPAVPFPGFNGLWAEGPDQLASLHDLEGAIEEVEGAGVSCWVELRAGWTPAIEQAVRRLGLTDQDSMPGMVVRPAELVVGPAPELEVATVRDAAGLATAGDLAAAGFGVPPELLAALYAPRVAALETVSIYVACARGAPVSTATTWTADGGVGVFNVATPPEHRGHGYGRAITTKAVEDAFKAGADLAWLQSSPLGESVYRAMGFRQVETYVILGRPSSGQS